MGRLGTHRRDRNRRRSGPEEQIEFLRQLPRRFRVNSQEMAKDADSCSVDGASMIVPVKMHNNRLFRARFRQREGHRASWRQAIRVFRV